MRDKDAFVRTRPCRSGGRGRADEEQRPREVRGG